jgi:hypothetical protein
MIAETLVQRGVIVETNVEYNETNTNVPSTISSRSTTANISQDSVCFNCKAELKKKVQTLFNKRCFCWHSFMIVFFVTLHTGRQRATRLFCVLEHLLLEMYEEEIEKGKVVQNLCRTEGEGLI